MVNRIVQGSVLAAALLITSAIPAAAQGAASAGITFFGDNLGVGIDADYARQYKSMGMDRTLSWLVDGAFAHKGEAGASLNTFMLDGGVRLEGNAGANATWHAQGTAGFMHTSLDSDLCDLLNIDCGGSTDFVIMPAGAVTYWFSATKGVKGQLGIPLVLGGDGADSTIRFDINFVWKLK